LYRMVILTNQKFHLQYCRDGSWIPVRALQTFLRRELLSSQLGFAF
jgi:hypothetical protein